MTLWSKSQQGLLRLGGVPWVASHSTASIATLSVWMVTWAPQIMSNMRFSSFFFQTQVV